MYTKLLKALLKNCLDFKVIEITFFWELNTVRDHVMYVNLPFCAFLGTNDVYLSQHSVNPTSTHIFYV